MVRIDSNSSVDTPLWSVIGAFEFVTVYRVAATIVLLQKSGQDVRRISRRVASIGVYAFPENRAVLATCRTRRSGPQTLGAPDLAQIVGDRRLDASSGDTMPIS